MLNSTNFLPIEKVPSQLEVAVDFRLRRKKPKSASKIARPTQIIFRGKCTMSLKTQNFQQSTRLRIDCHRTIH